MEFCFVNLAPFNVLWLKVTAITEYMLPVPLANGKRQSAKHCLIKPHRLREAEGLYILAVFTQTGLRKVYQFSPYSPLMVKA